MKKNDSDKLALNSLKFLAIFSIIGLRKTADFM